MKTIEITALADEMQKLFKEYMGATNEAMELSVMEVADEVKLELQGTSPYDTNPKRKRGAHYRDTWRHKYEFNTAPNIRRGTVYNYQYRLTHLLEYGHALKRGGRTVGTAKAYPHIEPAQQMAEERFVQSLKRRIEGL